MMSTTDDSFTVNHEPINIPKTSLREKWWHIMDSWKIGIVPLPLPLPLSLLILSKFLA